MSWVRIRILKRSRSYNLRFDGRNEYDISCRKGDLTARFPIIRTGNGMARTGSWPIWQTSAIHLAMNP